MFYPKKFSHGKEYEKAYILVLMLKFLVFNKLYKHSKNLLQDLLNFENRRQLIKTQRKKFC
jgi:hypothetical protein